MRAILFLAALATGASGCVHVMAAQSVKGKAFIVKSSSFGGSLWNCDASTGEPVCYKVIEIPLSSN